MEREWMRYLMEWEFDRDLIDETIKLKMAFMKEEELYPSKFYSTVLPPHYIGNGKGISIIEMSDPDQLVKVQVFLERKYKMKFIPITEMGEHITSYISVKNDSKSTRSSTSFERL